MTITDMIQLAGGVALFLYGMTIMGAGLEKVAGGKMQSILQKLTSSTIRGILLGTFITGIIQSSARAYTRTRQEASKNQHSSNPLFLQEF